MHRLLVVPLLGLLLGACAHRPLISPEEEAAAAAVAEEATAEYLGPAGSDWIDLPIVNLDQVLDETSPGQVWWQGLMKQIRPNKDMGECMLDQAEREPGTYEWAQELRLESPSPGVLRVVEVAAQAGPLHMRGVLECYERGFTGVEARRPGVETGQRVRVRLPMRYHFGFAN